MPIKSAKQFRLMVAAMHKKMKGGPSKKVAKEMLEHTSHEMKSMYASAPRPKSKKRK